MINNWTNEVFKERLDDLKEQYYYSIDVAHESAVNRKLNLTDDDLIDLTYGDVEIVESYMNTLLMLFYNCDSKTISTNDAARDLLWNYIDDEITFDDMIKKLKEVGA